MPEPLAPDAYRDLVRVALAEDVGTGDVTTQAIVPASMVTHGIVVAKAALTIAGLDVVEEVLRQVDPSVRMTRRRADGDHCAAGETLAEVEGPAASLLVAERTALNLIQALSGIATLTRAFVTAAAPLRVLDTRKTAPGQRALAKYAVRCGGGANHRAGLYDGVLIKDNHIRIAGSLAAAVTRARASAPGRPVEVEAQSMHQVDEALAQAAEVIMLDNFDDATTRRAVARIARRARIELSGNMTLERVARLADCGADDVSVGALTHSAPAADISLELAL